MNVLRLDTRFTKTAIPRTTAAPERLKKGKVLAGGALAVRLYGCESCLPGEGQRA
jgi:hypothetical protein